MKYNKASMESDGAANMRINYITAQHCVDRKYVSVYCLFVCNIG